MLLLDFLLHLLSFFAPAAFLSMTLVLWAWLRWGRQGHVLPLWQGGLLNFVLGALVLALGTVLGGHDGRMGTYALLVVVMASCQWLLTRTKSFQANKPQ